MAKSKGVQATSSARARAQQPSNAPAASLPTETLAQVFNLALEGLGAWERQKARLELARTCTHWYTAAEPGREVSVKDTKMAEEVAKSLNKQGAERRARVRSLSMGIEADGAGRSKRAAALFLACPRLDSIELVAAGTLYLGAAGGKGCQLGKPLSQALHRLSPREFSIISTREGTDTPWLDSRELLELCVIWTRLQSLTLDNVRTQTFSRAIPLPTLPPLPLARLRLPVPTGKGRPELAPLLAAASKSFRHLHLAGTIDRTNSMKDPLAPFASTIAIAPQLLTLVAISEDTIYSSILEEHWWPTLSALRDVQELRIGTIGYRLDEILPLLQRLQHLATLFISDKSPAYASARARHSRLTSTAVLDFIAEAPALQTLALPVQLRTIWTVEERAKVNKAAVRKGVSFAYE